MTRKVYLVVYHSPLFPAHWATWVSETDSESASGTGKLVHVVGDLGKGFALEVKRKYNPTTTNRKYTTILLAEVDNNLIVDVDVESDQESDEGAIDDLERRALGTLRAPAGA